MVFFTLLLLFLTGILSPAVAPSVATTPLVITVKTDYAANSEKLVWSPERRLNWEDFKGQPDEKNPHHALTAANMAVDASWKNNQFIYEVKCVFLPTESWSKNKSSYKLLAHEQLHFDLTEVHARQLRKQLKSLSINAKNLKSDLNRTVDGAFKEWKAEQELFDKLSKHGLDSTSQNEWAYSINTRLKELEPYQ
ncbi:DUF922 domain-containing protein [Pontibacter silvestris]|uniref:DUF922 domain-containing protein n=1 Tax=Pontibacter silvestris TaxID=2305183 RepID=A0ABW4WY78_9BACT|nr:DUF922 domain-containing protein [Pontibacter silvestris]MCC9135186.1 DUF922 domain-containing Zn-dependent protease [Pontibacter silvestris]